MADREERISLSQLISLSIYLSFLVSHLQNQLWGVLLTLLTI